MKGQVFGFANWICVSCHWGASYQNEKVPDEKRNRSKVDGTYLAQPERIGESGKLQYPHRYSAVPHQFQSDSVWFKSCKSATLVGHVFIMASNHRS